MFGFRDLFSFFSQMFFFIKFLFYFILKRNNFKTEMTVKDDANKCKDIANVILTSELDGQVCIFYFKLAKKKIYFFIFSKRLDF